MEVVPVPVSRRQRIALKSVVLPANDVDTTDQVERDHNLLNWGVPVTNRTMKWLMPVTLAIYTMVTVIWLYYTFK